MITYDLVKHLERQKVFSLKTFGSGRRTEGLIDHIKKELVEIEVNPNDIEEWIDVVLLALDGALRTGYSSEVIACILQGKLTKNENRKWPDWKETDLKKAIEHIKD